MPQDGGGPVPVVEEAPDHQKVVGVPGRVGHVEPHLGVEGHPGAVEGKHPIVGILCLEQMVTTGSGYGMVVAPRNIWKGCCQIKISLHVQKNWRLP